MWRALLLPLLIAPHLFAACQCTVRFGVCDEVRQTDAVFIGTVESVAPPFMDPYSPARGTVSTPTAEIMRLQADPAPDALEKLKTIYLNMFQGVGEAIRAEIARAATPHELESAFESAQSEGRVAHFRVRTLYKRDSGDDDDKKPAGNNGDSKDDDDKPAIQSLDIWTSGGDCGIDFQPGETYLVYAIEDEDSGRLETSVCMRTRRLSDEKGDLSYLYFLENDRKNSAQVAGFVSSSNRDQNLPRYEDSISFPYTGAVLELDTGADRLYTRSDSEGRFAFFGLKEGDYKLTLLSPGYPQAPRTEILSRKLHTDAGSCPREILILPAIRP